MWGWRRRASAHARPTCPECGRAAAPSRAAVFGPGVVTGSRWQFTRLLEGVYCDSECLLTAYLRGWPWCRVKNE